MYLNNNPKFIHLFNFYIMSSHMWEIWTLSFQSQFVGKNNQFELALYLFRNYVCLTCAEFWMICICENQIQRDRVQILF